MPEESGQQENQRLRLFDAALYDMEATGSQTFGPVELRDYARRQGFELKRAPDHISIDSVDRLSGELRRQNTMVFRLGGSEESARVRFGLARSVGASLSDYFLTDSVVFREVLDSPSVFLPTVPMRQLFSFMLLPSFQESSLVNLAVASGLLAEGLELDTREMPAAPATGQGVYSFKFKPNSEFEAVWEHRSGQVQIDALFTGRRQGKEVLFVLEAKASDQMGTIAKHKLLYSVLALLAEVPPYMPVAPVYLRCVRRDGELHFYLAECAPVNKCGPVVSVDSLSVRSAKHYVLLGIQGRGKTEEGVGGQSRL